MTVQYSRHVVTDIDSVTHFIAKDNTIAAARFYVAFDDTIEFLRRMPGMGTTVEPPIRRLPNLRKLTMTGFTAYIVYYQHLGAMLRVVRVLHHARDRDALLRNET